MNTRPSNSGEHIADLDLLEDARHSMRRKALECLAEADRLDALFAAITSSDPGAAVRTDGMSA